jgi:hypothetical protein
MKSGVPLSKIERHKQGKALRDNCPRTLQAEWEPRSKSKDTVKLLEESDADRIPGLIPVKYQRMGVSPFQKAIRSGRLSTEPAKDVDMEFLL